MTAATLSYARSTGRPRRLAFDAWVIGPVAALLLVGLVMVASASIVGIELVLSQQLQLVDGFSPLEAGFFILPIPLAAFVAGPLTGTLLPRLGAEVVLRSGLLLAAAGLAAYLLLHGVGTPAQIASLVVLGLGIGASMTAASSAIMFNAPPERAGMPASIEEVSFELGGGVWLSLWSRSDVDLAANPPRTSEICLAVEDAPAAVDAIYETWRAKGVRIVAEPSDEVFGRTFVAADPDGNLIRVAPID